MQMTKAAAVAILAYAASVAAYYPSSYGSIYAREAEAYPEAEFDFEDIYTRDVELDIHPRDAYQAGYKAGLYARAAPPAPQVAKPPTAYDSAKWGLDRTNTQESKVIKDEKSRESKLAQERKEFQKLEAEMKAQRQGINADKQGIKADDKAAEGFRKTMLNNPQQRRAIYDYEW